MYSLEIREEIDSAVSFHTSKLLPAIKLAIARANADLFHGPLYLSPDGEACSCFDEENTRFDFSAACEEIRQALENVSDLSVETSFDESTGESEYETVEDSRKAIIRGIVGKELMGYVL